MVYSFLTVSRSVSHASVTSLLIIYMQRGKSMCNPIQAEIGKLLVNREAQNRFSQPNCFREACQR